MKEFIVGNSYFHLSYIDEEYRFPEIITIVYLGLNLEEEMVQDKDDLWFFQDARSYLTVEPYTGSNMGVATTLPEGTISPAGQVYDFPEVQLHSILTANELIEELENSKGQSS